MKKIIFIGITLVVILTNCSPDFLDKKPLNQITVTNFYNTETDAFQAIMAAYSCIQSSPKFYGKEYWYIAEDASDDAVNKLDNEVFDSFNWSPIQGSQSEPFFSDLYLLGYEGVYRSNLVLDKVPNIKMDADKKKAILAEAHFLRALYYWHITTQFGEAALYDHVLTLDSIYVVPRSSRDLVYDKIEKDLLIAIDGLPDFWDAGNTGRATKWAAKAFLGKSYLHWACYTKRGNSDDLFKKSAVQLTDVINSGRFKLLDNYNSIFSINHENNEESVFEIQYAVRVGGLGWIDDIGVGGEGTQRDLIMGIQNQPFQTGYGEIIATQDLVKSFEIGDPRTKETVYFPYDSTLTGYQEGTINEYSGTLVYQPSYGTTVKATGNILGEYFHIKKAVSGYGGAGAIINSGNNWRMLRYADVLLMCAEALNESNGDRAQAAEYLNMVRRRAKANSKKNGANKLYGEKYDVRLKPIPYETISGTDLGPNGYLNDFPYYAINAFGLEFDFTDGSPESLRAAIVLERRHELAFEYHRFVDTKRWEAYMPDHPGAATLVLQSAGVTSYRKNIHQLYPIPQYQIDLMKGKLLQNPGYN